MNADKKLATVVLNLGDTEVAYRFCVDNREATVTIPARGIQTLVYDSDAPSGWQTDFFDDFETFNPDNWQDQMIWVNDEHQCYVPDNEYGTREVSNGSLKLKVVNIGKKRPCTNLNKQGEQHPDTQYVAGRICSKNRKEFVKGKWTARLRTWSNGEASMFPAWWILGAQNNEPPVQEPDETTPWPLTGSGEIDIFEHHGDHQQDEFTTGAIKSLDEQGKGDWWTLRKGIPATLDQYHEYSVEWAGSDLVYRVDGVEVHRNEGEGDKYPEAMFAILNYAKITDSQMSGEWVMEVDWVKHERWDDRFEFPDPKRPTNLQLVEEDSRVSLSWDAISGNNVRYSVYRTTRSGGKGKRIAYQLAKNSFSETAPQEGITYYYTVSSNINCVESGQSDVVHTALPYIELPARIEAENYAAMSGIQTEDCGDTGGTLNIGYFDPKDFIDFNISVKTTGNFIIDYRLASESGSEGFEVLIDNQVVDKQTVAATGGWQTYVTQTSPSFALGSGKHTLRFRSIGMQWNINWFEIKPQ